MPLKLFRFWRRRIFLRSTGWYLTRKRVFRQQGKYCQMCGKMYGLQVHHRDHKGQPKPRWWNFLPFARFIMFQQDYSDLIVLCDRHHKEVTMREIQRKQKSAS